MENALFVSMSSVSAYAGNKVIEHSIIGKGFSYRNHIYIYICVYISTLVALERSTQNVSSGT